MSKGIKLSKSFPAEVIVYECDTDDEGNPIYSVAASIDEIPEDYDGIKVATFFIHREFSFKVKKELK